MQVTFNWIGGATFILNIGDLTIAVDPVLCPKGSVQDFFWFKSKRIEEPRYKHSDFDKVDLWLITHAHLDHLDELGMSNISRDSKVISNANAYKVLKREGLNDLSSLKWHQSQRCQINGYNIKVEAIPAIHGVNPISALMAGPVNGYYLNISKDNESTSLYITGDTVYKRSIVKALVNKTIDLMIPNMGAAKSNSWIMTLTLNARMLKKLIAKLNPKTVIPVHYGTFEHYNEPLDAILDLYDNRIKIVNVGEKITLP